MQIGLLIIRIVAGLLLAGHGAQKLFGWFGGHGLEGTGGFFGTMGYQPPRTMAFLAGLGEGGGGALLALGLLNPLGAAAVIGVMLNVIVAAHFRRSPWASQGGWELPGLYAALAAGLGFSGPGRYSFDRLFGWHLAGNAWGLAAVVVGLVAAAAVLARRQRNLPAVEPAAAPVAPQSLRAA